MNNAGYGKSATIYGDQQLPYMQKANVPNEQIGYHFAPLLNRAFSVPGLTPEFCIQLCST